MSKNKNLKADETVSLSMSRQNAEEFLKELKETGADIRIMRWVEDRLFNVLNEGKIEEVSG
tara:strand:+ start:249 stop:431 length:183 start_codon:yes stop_codon:yes gene_type:complete